MKNKKVFACLIFVFSLLGFLFGIISYTQKIPNYLKHNMAEMTTQTFCGYDKEFTLSYRSGVREQKFSADGVAGKNIDFGVLTVFVRSAKLVKKEMRYQITIDNQTLSGEFDINPFDNSFIADTQKQAKQKSAISVKILYDNKERTYELLNAFDENDTSAHQVFSIASKKLKPILKKHTSFGRLFGEFFVQTVWTGQTHGQTKPFWHVTFVCKKHGQSYTVVINGESKQVVATFF